MSLKKPRSEKVGRNGAPSTLTSGYNQRDEEHMPNGSQADAPTLTKHQYMRLEIAAKERHLKQLVQRQEIGQVIELLPPEILVELEQMPDDQAMTELNRLLNQGIPDLVIESERSKYLDKKIIPKSQSPSSSDVMDTNYDEIDMKQKNYPKTYNKTKEGKYEKEPRTRNAKYDGIQVYTQPIKHNHIPDYLVSGGIPDVQTNYSSKVSYNNDPPVTLRQQYNLLIPPPASDSLEKTRPLIPNLPYENRPIDYSNQRLKNDMRYR